MGSHERERNWKGGDAVLSCSVTVLNTKPLLRSNCVLKLANGMHVTNRVVFMISS